MSKISVVIPHYNSGLDIKRAYDSVLKQTLLPSEIIIVDDCSLSKDILNDIINNHNIDNIILKVIFMEENKGPSYARNLGVESSCYEYVAFLDSDDVWVSNKLEIQYKVMVENNLNFIFHLYSAFPIEIIKKEVSLKKVSLFDLAKKQIICTPTVMAKKSSLKKFNIEMRYCEDFLCWVMSNNCKYFYYIDSYLANGFKRQYGESGLSSNMYNMHLGVLKSFKILYSCGYIGLWEYILFSGMEYVKYPLRIFKNKFF